MPTFKAKFNSHGRRCPRNERQLARLPECGAYERSFKPHAVPKPHPPHPHPPHPHPPHPHPPHPPHPPPPHPHPPRPPRATSSPTSYEPATHVSSRRSSSIPTDIARGASAARVQRVKAPKLTIRFCLSILFVFVTLYTVTTLAARVPSSPACAPSVAAASPPRPRPRPSQPRCPLQAASPSPRTTPRR